MSDTPTPTTSPESPADGQTPEVGTPATPEPQNGSDSQNPEVRYRIRAREAENALAAAEARIAQFQRAEVERLASESLAMPGDLFSLSGNELADYLTEAGDVDPDKVAADVAAVLAERPGLRKNAPAFDPTQGHGGRTTPKAWPTAADLFRQRS
jgi:hypothetical protein